MNDLKVPKSNHGDGMACGVEALVPATAEKILEGRIPTFTGKIL